MDVRGVENFLLNLECGDKLCFNCFRLCPLSATSSFVPKATATLVSKMSTVNGSLGLPDTVLDQILEEVVSDSPDLPDWFRDILHTNYVVNKWIKETKERLSITAVCRLWNILGRRHWWGSIFLYSSTTEETFTTLLRKHPHNLSLVRRVTILSKWNRVHNLLPFLRLFSNGESGTSQSESSNIRDRCSLRKLQIINVLGFNNLLGVYTDLLDTISGIESLQSLSLHCFDALPWIPKPNSLPHLKYLETSLTRLPCISNHATTSMDRKQVLLPSLSRLCLRDLSSETFGETLFSFIREFKDTLTYVSIHVTGSPKHLNSLDTRFTPINIKQLHHIEISFPYQASLLKYLAPSESLETLTVTTVPQISHSISHYIQEFNQGCKSLNRDYTPEYLLSNIHDTLVANQNVAQLKTVILRGLKTEKQPSKEDMEYWYEFRQAAEKWANVFGRVHRVTLLAMFVKPSKELYTRFLNEENKPSADSVVDAVDELLQDWMERLE